MAFPNGSVKVIDRSKNIFKLSQGEYIAPEKIENMLALSPMIAQSIIYGDSLRSCTVAIVVPNPDQVKKFSEEKKISQDEVHTDATFKALVADDIKRIGIEQKLSGLEKPKDILIYNGTFSVENNLLTPTFKLKRNVARDFFKKEIDQMYSKLD